MGEDPRFLGSRREVRAEIARRRALALGFCFGAIGLALQLVARLSDADDPSWFLWVTAVAFVVGAVAAAAAARRWRRAREVLAGMRGVELAPVTETRLSQLVAAALDGAAPDEVTPPVTSGERWTPERIAWLRAFHRDRRPGLDGPAREATWAVVEVGAEGDRVVGGVRLRRTGRDHELEAGIWLVRDARGRGLGRSAMERLLDRAREAGAATVRAETTAANTGAVSLLRTLGFTTMDTGERVRAELALVP